MTLNFIMNKYRVLGKKGEGTFSEVLKCQNIKDGTYWACKKMKQHYESIEQVNNLREIQAMRRLSPHPNILDLNEVIFDRKSGTLVLICELMDMNIYELIRGRRHYLPDPKIKKYMYQLCKSIDHMHRNGIFHRDVKPENILIKEDLLKLADFGSCRGVYSKQPYTEYISTRWYRAPECLLTDGYYTYKMDIWSVGCVFFEIMSLHPLFPGSNEVDQIAKIHDILGTPDPNVINKLRNKTRGMNFNFPQKKGTGLEKLLPHASSDCIDLIYQMCTYDPEERISAKQSLRHPYFKEFREAEKRAAAIAKSQKSQEAKKAVVAPEKTDQLKGQEKSDNEKQMENSKPKDNGSDQDKENLRIDDKKVESSDEPQPKKSPSVRQGSGSTVARFPSNIIHKDPIYTYHRRERKRRKKQHQQRMAESGPSPQGATFFPKVTGPKPSTFQPTFHTTSYNTGPTSLPKINATTTSTTTTTYLPSLTQAFVKPAKPKPQASKNMYGQYQLPSIDRRGAGY